MTETKEQNIQIAAFKLGFEKPKVFNSLETLRMILRERKIEETSENAIKMLQELYNDLDEDVYCFWCDIAILLPSKQKSK
jgi:hypothetical protein